MLIKLWNQGKKAEGALLDSDNGRVYPMYKDTVYVRWTEDEDEDGNYSMVFFKGLRQAQVGIIEYDFKQVQSAKRNRVFPKKLGFCCTIF